MDKIALIGDVHANLTALEAVLEDIEKRNISKIYCLGDIVSKSVNPDIVIDIIKEKCDVILKGNCDEIFSSERALTRQFWTRMKIGEKRAKFLRELPIMHEFYLSGKLIRLFHASPYSLEHIYNPEYNNHDKRYNNKIIINPMELFKNTDFIGKSKNDKIPDVIGYAHLHMPIIFKVEDKIIFNTGSVGASYNKGEATYTIVEGELNSQKNMNMSISNVSVYYNLEKEIKYIEESDIPTKDDIIAYLKN
ncbi:MAG TPA: hypothetical protein DEP51_01950 [Clostridiales bacterium]|nr:hypothetical protein [Clostridiales bacterium]